MKNSRPLLVALAAALFLSTTGPAPAQGGPGGPNSGMNPAMLKMFGDVKGFSAKTEMRVLQGQKEVMSGTINFAMLDGKTRMEMDLTQMKSAQMPPEFTAQIKQMGMDVNIVLSLPDKNLTRLVYPNLKAYLELPQPPVAEAKLKMVQKELGKETIDGHPCVKNQVTVTDEAGKKSEAVAWNATDLKGFPIQVELQEQQGTSVIMRYKDIKLAKPDAKLFEPPVGFKKYTSQQELMQGEVLKRLGGK